MSGHWRSAKLVEFRQRNRIQACSGRQSWPSTVAGRWQRGKWNPRVYTSGCHPCWWTFSGRDRQCLGYHSDCWLSRRSCGSCPLVPLSFRSMQFFSRCSDSKTLIEIFRLSGDHRICWGTNLVILLKSGEALSLLTFRRYSCRPSTWKAEPESCSLARVGIHWCRRTLRKGCSGCCWFNWSVYWYTVHQKVGNLDPVRRLLEEHNCSSFRVGPGWLLECTFVALLVEYWV